ncbi:MAG: RluA family pseudouridine synthase [Planctomycetes bacterium]|nr:RluA family pseudouridine synthase [Planctomycetota bacterium]
MTSDSFTRSVPASEAGMRLDAFLARQPEVRGRTTARRLLDQGCVTVPGQVARPGLCLRPDMVVEVQLPPGAAEDPLAPALPLPAVPVLYEDAWMCVIDKPPGLAAHPPEDRRSRAHTVASWALARFGELPTAPDTDRPGIVHRLDRDTSGVMVIARTQAALDALRAQWRARTVTKEYRCLVFGVPRFHSDWIERPIAPDPRHPDRMTVVDDGGRESQTYYEVVERFDGFADVRCRPHTGRTHQIRVHMTSIGHSLVGDRTYRSRSRQHERLPAGAPDPGRQCLHAQRLELQHPFTEERLVFAADLPADLRALRDWLRRYRPGR